MLDRLSHANSLHSLLFPLAFGIVTLACAADGPTPPAVELQAPTVTATVEFGDPPLSGSLVLTSRSPKDTWAYEVDFEDDTTMDAHGELSSENTVSVPFNLTVPGVYPVSISFVHPDTTILLTRYIVVNDLDVFGDIHRVQVPRANPNTGFEGVAVNPELNRIYVGEAFQRRVLMLSLDSTELLAVADNLGPGNTLEGFAISEEEQNLHVIDKSHSLHVFDGLTLESLLHIPQFGAAEFFIEITADGTLWASFPGLVAWQNGDTRTVLSSSSGIWHFDVFGENERILIINLDPIVEHGVSSPGIGVIDENGALQWHTSVDEDFIPWVVAFSPDGQFAYVLGFTLSRVWKFMLLSGIDGSLQYEMRLGACSTFCFGGAANPITQTTDGRFLVIPTDAGVYFIDTLIHLPRFRSPGPPSDFCCNVAAIAGTSRLLFVTTELVFLEFQPPHLSQSFNYSQQY